MKNYFTYYVFLFLGLLLSKVAIGDPAEYQFGGGLMAFDYAEYLDNNEFLDGETGLIPGLVLKRKQNYELIFTELVGQLYGNTIEYDGQTQGGTPVKTDSIAIIIDTHFKLGLLLAQRHEPYIGLGFRYWYRHIQNGRDVLGNSVAGLLEEYYWPYRILGYAANFDVSEKVTIGFDLRYTQMFDAKMDIDFLGFQGYDNTQVNLGNESGARFALPINIKIRRHALIVTPYYEKIDIGKSNLVGVTRGGVPTATVIYEPRSETRNVGIEIMWLW